MGKNSHRNKKKVAQKKQERMNSLIEEKVAERMEEESNPWKELRKEMEERKKNPAEKSSEADSSRLKTKKIERAVLQAERSREETHNRPIEYKEIPVYEEKPPVRRYMYDSTRTRDDGDNPEKIAKTAAAEKERAEINATFEGRNKPEEKTKKVSLFSALVRLFSGSPKPQYSDEDSSGAGEKQSPLKVKDAHAPTGTKEKQSTAETKEANIPKETEEKKSTPQTGNTVTDTDGSNLAAVTEEKAIRPERRHLSKRVKRILTAVVSVLLVCVLVTGFLAFKFMVKYGSLKYLYNYRNKTQGSLKQEYDESASQGADGDVPHSVPETDPEKFGVREQIESKGKIVETINRDYKIKFDTKNDPESNAGFSTFRGNYRRDASSVSTVSAGERTLVDSWEYKTGKLLKNTGSDYWSGNGWTGQPLLAKWEDSVRAGMNMYESAKNKNGLVEIIYPGMDGQIHFLDLETGEETRPVINVGMTFKGTASLYPGGVPLLFCGCGDAQTGPFGENVSQRFYIYSLIDGSLLYEGGMNDSFAPRQWHAYDSSPLIDPGSDTLIYPGENGVIYTMRLNTEYKKEYSSVSIKPSPMIKYTFTIDNIYAEDKRLWGSECSACAWNGYIFLGDNAGMFYCLDVNAMKMVWITDLKEDINSSPILSFEDDGTYIYVGTTLKYGYNEHSMGEAAIYKLNAVTGRTVWKKGYEVNTVKGYAGGVLSTGVLGKGEIGDYVIYSVSKTPSLESGYLVALNKKTGHEDWRITLDMYSWSSTILTYDNSGMPLIIQGCQNGDLLLIDARDGKILNRLNFGSAIEATPVMYADRLVIAVRGEKIYGAQLK